MQNDEMLRSCISHMLFEIVAKKGRAEFSFLHAPSFRSISFLYIFILQKIMAFSDIFQLYSKYNNPIYQFQLFY